MNTKENPGTTLDQFIDYCMTFYGPGGVYDLAFTPDQIRLATGLLLTTDADFCGDTVDRERVRDIVLAARQEFTQF